MSRQKQPDTFLGGAKAREARQPLLDYWESTALWDKHTAAVDRARAAGACRRCALEMGLLATPNRPEDEPRNYEFHPLCLKRMESRACESTT